MAYEKIHESIDFKNRQAPSITADVLNRREATFEELDNRTVELSTFNDSIPYTYATKAEVEEVSQTVGEIATEVSKGKADVILANEQGETIHLTDSTDNKTVEFALLGKATQNGTPTPDAPIDITVSGADGSVEVKSLGKNLIPYPYDSTTMTSNGITWTDLGDGRIMANGTATADSPFNCQSRTDTLSPFILPAGTYILSGCPSGGSTTTYRNLVGRTNPTTGAWEGFGTDVGNGVTFTITEESTTTQIQLMVKSGTTVNNLIFEPMISLEGGKYEPYKESTTTITTEGGLAGIMVESGGNYTDASGHQWVTDEIVKYADGSGQYIQRIGHKTYNGSESIWRRVANETYSTVFYGDNSLLNMIGNRDCLCNRFLDTKLPIGQVTSGHTYYNLNSNMIYFAYGENSEENTLEGWKEFLSNNNLEFYYVLAEPIITDLSAEQIEELEAVQTFYPTTNILNDAVCEMKVTYKADTKNYIINHVPDVEVQIATTENVGVVKPDGVTISIDEDGTIHSKGGIGGGGTFDYSELYNKPSINGVELDGDKTLEKLGINAQNIGAVESSELSQAAFSGSYNDLSNKPTIPTKISDLQNDSNFISSELVLDSSEEIEANTESGRIAGALAVKELINKTKENEKKIGESEIGTFNGKKLFRRIISVDSVAKSTSVYIDSTLKKDNIETLISLKGGFYVANSNIFSSIPYLSSDSFIRVTIDTSGVKIQNTITQPLSKVIVILEYTKI